MKCRKNCVWGKRSELEWFGAILRAFCFRRSCLKDSPKLEGEEGHSLVARPLDERNDGNRFSRFKEEHSYFKEAND